MRGSERVPPHSSGTSPLSPGAAGRGLWLGLWLQAGDEGWPGSCWKDALSITLSPCLGREGSFPGPWTFGSRPASVGGITASRRGPWERQALPAPSLALPAAPRLGLSGDTVPLPRAETLQPGSLPSLSLPVCKRRTILLPSLGGCRGYARKGMFTAETQLPSLTVSCFPTRCAQVPLGACRSPPSHSDCALPE